MNDRIAQNHCKVTWLVIVGTLLSIPLVLGASFAAAEGITWQITRQTHLDRFHELRMRRLAERVQRKHIDSDLAADLRTANEYTPGEKTMRLEILVAFAAGLTAVLGLLFWAFAWSPSKKLLTLCGARPASDEEREARNLLEDLSLSAGLIPPELYIIDSPSPNAFALGMTPETAVVVVTQGLLALLDRRELEAVLAHELSHIANLDTRPNTIVAALARLLCKPRLLAAAVVRWTISPDSEFLADADAATLTGYPEGLRRALAKVGEAGSGDTLCDPAIAHLYFAGASTPIAERIAELQQFGRR